MDLTVSTADHSGVTVVSVSGEIDVYTAPRLRDRLTELVDQGKYRLVVDLTDVRFMDSTGLGVLVGALKKVRTHAGRLDLVCDNERLLKIFKITGLTKVFVIHPVVGTALDD